MTALNVEPLPQRQRSPRRWLVGAGACRLRQEEPAEQRRRSRRSAAARRRRAAAGLHRQCRRPRLLRHRFDLDPRRGRGRRSTGRRSGCSKYPHYAITIEGHADERGTREYNIALGARRAAVARDYLVVARRRRRTACGRSPTARSVRSRSATTSPAGRRTAAPSPCSAAPACNLAARVADFDKAAFRPACRLSFSPHFGRTSLLFAGNWKNLPGRAKPGAQPIS